MAPPSVGRLAPTGRTTVEVASAPDAVWEVVADPTLVAEWSHETRAARWLPPAAGASVGARFRGHNRLGPLRWSRVNEITAVEPGHLLSWRTVPSRRFPDSTLWTLRLEPAGTGTRITQEFEILRLHPFLDRLFYVLLPPHRDRSAALAADLRRIGELAARGAP